jgi:hypothetical protein
MKKTVSTLIVILLLLFSGCSSLSTWVRSNFEGVPVWVYEPKISRDQTAFVGSGTADSQTRARVLAYESVLRQISDSIGEDVVGTYIAELSTRDSIEAYRLRITQEFVKQEENSTTVYFLAIADKEVLERARTDAEVQLLESQREMDRLSQEAAQAFRENRDLEAAGKYLQIAIIAKALPVDRGRQRYDDAIERVRKILLALRLTVSEGDPTIPTTVVTLRRGSRSLSPRVEQAAVMAFSMARDGMGNSYQDTQRFVTDSSGQFTFTSNNPTLVGRGTIGFEVDFSPSLEQLEKLDGVLFNEFSQIVADTRIEYPYARISILGGQSLLVAMSEYSLQGTRLGSTSAGRALAGDLSKDGLRVVLTQGPQPEDDEDILDVLKNTFGDYRAVVYGNVGISHIKETGASFAVTVTGESLFADIAGGRIIGRTGSVNANAVATTLQDATQEAFARYGNISASLLMRYLFK